MKYIYKYLKEHYPATEYAEQFAVSEAWGCNSYWALELGITYADIAGKGCGRDGIG